MYKVAEIFTSINGEGRSAGQLATFIRFSGCNLDCTYCDTKWANLPDAKYTVMSADEIYSHIKMTGINHVTITGGEPLIQPDIYMLLKMLAEDNNIKTEIETNGAVDISDVINIGKNRPSLTMDYKLPSCGMEQYMHKGNLNRLEEIDTVKFVSGSLDDLECAYRIITENRLTDRCAVFISPVFGKIEPSFIVDFMKEKKLNGVSLQLQLHKFIWNPEKRGV